MMEGDKFSYLTELIKKLVNLSSEEEWFEFKENNINPDSIGEYISALSNSALLAGETGYLIWGINDKTHDIVGTYFDYRTEKIGNEDLIPWLSRLLNPKISFEFSEVYINDKRLVVLEIPPVRNRPLSFKGKEYIRVGSTKKNLVEYPEKERLLWRKFEQFSYELSVVDENISVDDIFAICNIDEYYNKLGFSRILSKEKIINDLEQEKFIIKNNIGNYNLTFLGYLTIGKNLKSNLHLNSKVVRVIKYQGIDRFETIREEVFNEGYVISYEKIISYILSVIPQKEEIGESGIRKIVYDFPEIAIRELLSNAMIHQDLEKRGTKIMVEIFSNRIEFSNIGTPLISIDRLVDTVPNSRNENLSGFMNRCGICEERGSGYDKIINVTEKFKLIAPKVEVQENKFTKVTLYSKIPYAMITKEDKLRTCYMHSCLYQMRGLAINNASVRNLFNISQSQSTRVLKDTYERGLIKLYDESNKAPRHVKYVPFWAK